MRAFSLTHTLTQIKLFLFRSRFLSHTLSLLHTHTHALTHGSLKAFSMHASVISSFCRVARGLDFSLAMARGLEKMNTYTHAHTQSHTHTHILTYTHIHTRLHTVTHKHTHICTRARTHTHRHTHTHTHTNVCSSCVCVCVCSGRQRSPNLGHHSRQSGARTRAACVAVHLE